MVNYGPGWWDPYVSGEVVQFDLDAVAEAARALAILNGDGRLYDEDPDAREGFAECVRVVVGVYLQHSRNGGLGNISPLAE